MSAVGQPDPSSSHSQFVLPDVAPVRSRGRRLYSFVCIPLGAARRIWQWARPIDGSRHLSTNVDMTETDIDQRIILSRHTLAAYIRGIQQTGIYPIADLPLLRDEINILQAIAGEHPSKAMELLEVLSWWRAFEANVRAKLH
jgi:hypothetical protein